MKELSAKLISLLNEELFAYEKLHGILKEEKTSLTLCDYERLNETLKRKENEIINIRCIEKKLHKLLEDIKIKSEISKSDAPFEFLINMCDNTYKFRLKTTWINLQRLANDVTLLNSSNKNIVEHLLSLVTDSFSLLSNMAAKSPIYYSTGRFDKSTVSGSLLSGSI